MAFFMFAWPRGLLVYIPKCGRTILCFISSPSSLTSQLPMDTNFDPQAYSDCPLGLGYRVNHSAGGDKVRTETDLFTFDLANGLQDDYSMTDAFDLRDGDSQHRLGPEHLSTSGSFAHHEDPLDYRFGAPHMLILDNLPADIPRFSSQTMNSPLGGLARNHIYANETSQSPRYWEFVQSPQPTYSGQSNGVCPNPTFIPNLTCQLELAGIDDRSCPPVKVYRNARTIITLEMDSPFPFRAAVKQKRPQLPSCDHTTCNPPPDVGFLSRRFPENENWIRARASAVAFLAHRRSGSK